ncbi:unnamed protein product [Discosporangium mesarthrocarpum]
MPALRKKSSDRRRARLLQGRARGVTSPMLSKAHLLLVSLLCQCLWLGKSDKKHFPSVKVKEFSPKDEKWTLTGGGRPDMPTSAGQQSNMPPRWDSTKCLKSWNMSHIQTEVDPNGYYLVMNSREQLGGVASVLADAAFVARSLNRTLVELPVSRSMVANAESWRHGIGVYWDMDKLCQSNRVLDLHTFISLVERGIIPQSTFVTITEGRNPRSRVVSNMETEIDAVNSMEELGVTGALVIVVTGVAKTEWYERAEERLLTPNPFYLTVVKRLLTKEGWHPDNYMAIQWRTENSLRNLTDCYTAEVRGVVEEHRQLQNLSARNVFFNTDMREGASHSYRYNPRKVKGNDMDQMSDRVGTLALIDQDYSGGSHIWDAINMYDDSGVQAIVGGLVSAHARVLLLSSTENNRVGHSEVHLEHTRCLCFKRRSKFLGLIIHWREELVGSNPGTTTALFHPPVKTEDSPDDHEEDVCDYQHI